MSFFYIISDLFEQIFVPLQYEKEYIHRQPHFGN